MNLIVFGDSITYGLYDEQGGWAERLYKEIRGKAEVNDFINLSRPGAASKQIISKVKSAARSGLLSRVRTLVIFAYGINDSAINLREQAQITPIERFEENTIKIIEMINQNNADMVFVGPTIVDDPLAGSFKGRIMYSNDRIKKYDRSLEKICTGSDVDFIELYDECSKENTGFQKMLHDGVHPDENGHRFILGVLNKTDWFSSLIKLER